MKKMIAVLLALVLLGGLAATALWYSRNRQYAATHVTVGGREYPVDLEQLDMRGEALSPDDYESICRLLPDCQILWNVPFQDTTYPSDTTEITVDRLAMEDLDRLSYFPNLSKVDARKCRDLDVVEELKLRMPQCEVLSRLAIGEFYYDPDVTELDIDAQAGEDFLAALPKLTSLESVHLAEGTMDAQQLLNLRETYPDIDFTWEKTVMGTTYPDSVTELDFSGMELPPLEELEADLAYLPGLEKLILSDCGIDDETMAAFRDRVRDQYQVVWTVYMGKITVRTDATALMAYQFGYNGNIKLRQKDCGPMKYLEDLVCLDLGHMDVKDISFVQYMPDLQYLLVCDNGIKDISPLAGLQNLKFLEIFHNDITDVSSLAQCPALEDVNMCYNKVKDIAPILEMKALKNLWMSGMYLNKDQMDQLEKTFPDAHIEYFVQGSVGKGWRNLPNYYAQRDLLDMWYLE